MKQINYLKEHDKVFVENVINLIESAVITSQRIDKKRIEAYFNLLNDVEKIFEETKSNLSTDESENNKLYLESTNYLKDLRIKLYKLTEIELVENQVFRAKNLRGAKIEDLYFEIYGLIKETYVKQDGGNQGLIEGNEILRFIEENFDYKPIRKRKLSKNGNEIDENFVIYSSRIKERDDFYDELDKISKETKHIYIIAKNEVELYSKAKVLFFKWINLKYGGIKNFKDREVSFTVDGREDEWDTVSF